jgi:two-component sensor histidine kinase
MTACVQTTGEKSASGYKADSLKITLLIKAGDRIYAQKNSYEDFLKSMETYETAYREAQRIGDTFLLAESTLAKGRAYDALNSNPQKTIDYYTQAASLYAHVPDKPRALYIKQLVAHAYDKVKDSLQCIAVLQELYAEIKLMKDSVKRQLTFISEMALISTEVKNYTLADSILTRLTRREWIHNDSSTYNYLDHYFITKARIQVYHNHDTHSQYLDSLQRLLKNSKNLSDSMYYSSQLWELYKYAGITVKEAAYLRMNNEIFARFNPPQSVREAQKRVSEMEVAAVEMQRILARQQADARRRSMYILVGLLGIISLLTLYLLNRLREIKRRKKQLYKMNDDLQQKNKQNELLNKELHHRVKNNLQMIMSLVEMQERSSDDNKIKGSLQEIKLRIESIASLHQQMLLSNEHTVQLNQYFRQLVHTVTMLVPNDKELFTEMAMDDVALDADISFPLGLLMNEWVTNSIKYAKSPHNKLYIFISARVINNEKLEMTYHDSGMAVHRNNMTPGLGTKIIALLAAQLQAIVERPDADYFRYRLIIPLHG